MPWHLQTKKQFKIWFTLNPEEFLPTENKLRLIRAMLANPSTLFSFVYSSKILSEFALSELNQFCKRLKVEPIDIDSQNFTLHLNHDLDQVMYTIAKAEINHALAKSGGNLAAASDILRTLPSLIELAGIYSDFDVEVNFESLAANVEIQSPILTAITLEQADDHLTQLSINNEIFAVATDRSTSKIHKDALASIRHLQQEQIRRYTQPGIALTSPVFNGLLTMVNLDPTLTSIIKLYNESHQAQSIFHLRLFIQNLSILDLCQSVFKAHLNEIFGQKHYSSLPTQALNKAIGAYRKRLCEHTHPGYFKNLSDEKIALAFLDDLKSLLYKASVITISGPQASMALFESKVKDIDFSTLFDPSQPPRSELIHDFQCASLKGNKIDKLVIGQDTQRAGTTPKCDESWTESGAKSSKARSEDIEHRLINLQRIIKRSLKLNPQFKR